MTIEELQAQLIAEQEKNKQLQAEYDSLKIKSEEDATKITTLTEDLTKVRETNMQLFLRVTQPTETTTTTSKTEEGKQETEEKVTTVDDILKEFKI